MVTPMIPRLRTGEGGGWEVGYPTASQDFIHTVVDGWESSYQNIFKKCWGSNPILCLARAVELPSHLLLPLILSSQWHWEAPRVGISSILSYRWEKGGPKRWSDLFKGTQLITNRKGAGPQVFPLLSWILPCTGDKDSGRRFLLSFVEN
jgi:hypothetical protein